MTAPSDALLAAQQALAERRYEAALAAAETALAADPVLAEAWRAKAQALAHLRRAPEAEAACREGLAADPENAGLLVTMATLRLLQGRPEDGVRMVEQALALAPDFPDAWICRAQIRLQQRAVGDALDDAGRAVALAPEHPGARIVLARVLRLAERGAESIEAYREAARLDAGNPATIAMLAEALAEANRFPEAEAAWRDALAGDPDNARFRGRYAGTLSSLGRFEEAIAAGRAAHGAAPTDYATCLNLAGALLASGGDAGEAVRLCEAALAANPRATRATAYKAIALLRLGQAQAAEALLGFDRLLRAMPAPVPPGYPDAAAFRVDLVRAIRADPGLVYEPRATTTRGGYQSSDLLVRPDAPFQALRGMLLAAVRRYAEAGREEPYLKLLTQTVGLYAWANVLESGGRQLPHIHPSAVLSGVYYAQLPPDMEEGPAGADQDEAGRAGWIEFGRPGAEFPLPGEPPTRLVRPEEGMVVLFPSYLYHRTLPFESASPRISVAFDVLAT